ncbi:MAG: TadE-like protein [Gemmatimonadota bacterium]|jgi:Flp pilus assembly protein TadG
MNSHSPARAICVAVRRFVKADDAGPIVEFALVAPILMLIILAIADFSLAFLTRNNLVSAVREGARLGAVQASDPCVLTNTTTIAAIKSRVKVYLTPNSGTLPAGFSESTGITVTCSVAGYIEVQVINFPYQPVTPIFGLLKLFVGNATTIPLSASAVYRWERS